MAAPKLDPAVAAHLEWLGFVRPTGLVVSAPALVRVGAILDRNDGEGQRLLRAAVEQRAFPGEAEPAPWLPDFRTFASSVLGWGFSPNGYAGTPESPIPPELELAFPDGGGALRPDFAVRELEPQSGRPGWQLLVSVVEPGQDLDLVDSAAPGGGQLEASAHGRLERLLRQTGVSAGLLSNGRVLRLLSAPYGESSGWIDFRVADMVRTAGRPICTALRLLLDEPRLLSLPRSQRLAALLEGSRKFQNEVSERLAEQVLHALYELLRGFQAAHDASGGRLLRDPLAEHPDDVYRALLTVILRLVFLLYAEERDMLPEDETFLRSYSLAGLYDRLREDAALYPDTMDERFGAWAQLLVLFRMVFDGADWGTAHLPKRHGVLFDPDRFKFLEGRSAAGARQVGERIEPPRVPDGTIYRALEKLLVLDGQRISYRALDVEQIGSVYETMMGFRLETAVGRSAAIKPQKKQGAPTAVDLEALLDEAPAKREKWLEERTGRNFAEGIKKRLKAAATLEDLHAALDPAIDKEATPDLVPPGAMVLQPSEERRRSGSHYTPRSLTEPIVRTTLEPVLARLRGAESLSPTPEQILDLKVCDPAMGSGAFLVEACRQLGDALIEAWKIHGGKPAIPPDEDEVIFARRLVAQRCLYGVDKNPMAVDLAKVSLWLATLAKDHALTFVDHALRHGDSLVGLSRKQIEALQWEPTGAILRGMDVREPLDRVMELRRRIREADDSVPDWELRDLWDQAQGELSKVRLFGDLVLAAFFEEEKPKDRERKRHEYEEAIRSGEAESYRSMLEDWRDAEKPLVPFHWEIEFPEVFDRERPGFDAFVGNPPFSGKNTTANANLPSFPDWLQQVHSESHGNADLVAHFFRRAFVLLRQEGAFGLIATNTIAQGDTRSTGLCWIRQNRGEIFAVTRRVRWPGLAAVVVSVVHVMKGCFVRRAQLDGRPVGVITAFLFHRGGDDDPKRLVANSGKSFVGSYVLGMGFTFDDSDKKGIATPLAEMQRLIQKAPSNQEVIYPYIGGEEVNGSAIHAHHRYVINFGERSEEECRRRWPDLMAIVEARVKPERMNNNRSGYRRYWWQYAEKRAELYSAVEACEKVLVQCRITSWLSFALLKRGLVYDVTLNVFPTNYDRTLFPVLQSRIHEIWAKFFGSSMKDDLRYTPADCFETFPFPSNWETHPILEAAGKAYYDSRADLMVRNNEGLTKTYNRFHDPNEQNPDILKLRERHAAMDRAVLDAYGWTDIPTDCEFILDYEIDEEESGKKKKPYRYRWPDDVRDEVLARLLELNARRAQEEARAGLTAGKNNAKKPGVNRVAKSSGTGDLFS
jgi:hypothetical protein